MKLLLENWREYLTERATDEAFTQTVDFLVDTFTDPKNFDFVSDEEEKEYMGDMEGWGSPGLGAWPRALFDTEEKEEPKKGVSLSTYEFSQVEPRMEQNWDRFVDQHPGVAEQLGLDPDTMLDFMVLQVVYGYPLATRWSTGFNEKSDLTTAGYFNGDAAELIINFKASKFNISEEQYRQLNENDILKFLSQHASVVRMVVDHEFTHMLNYLRAGKSWPRAKGLKRHHYQRPEGEQDAIKYANSTEEIQARLIPIFKIVREVAGMDQDKIPKTDINAVAKLINIEAANFSGNKSLSNIIKLLHQMYELHHPNFLKWTSKSNKKRITKRFYEFAEDLVSK